MRNLKSIREATLALLNPIPIAGERQVYRKFVEPRTADFQDPPVSETVVPDYIAASLMRIPTYVLYGTIAYYLTR